jgi:hypothetical protein
VGLTRTRADQSKRTDAVTSLTTLDEDAIAASMNDATLPPQSRLGLRPFRRHFHDDDGHIGYEGEERREIDGGNVKE